MRFAHLADSHLGKRLLGHIENEQDYYMMFQQTIDRIIESDVDFVVHSGDIFDNHKPSPNALFEFQKGLIKLRDNNIPVYAIAGNHDMIFRRNEKSPVELYSEFGMKLLDEDNPFYIVDDTFIGGIPYKANWQRNDLLEQLDCLSRFADDYENSIIVLHQGIAEYLPFGYELSLNELPKNFNYYALGHLHYNVLKSFGLGVLAYANSLGIGHAYDDWSSLDKGFNIVEITDSRINVERVDMGYPRMWIKITVEYDNLEQELDNLANAIKQLDYPPMLELTINGSDKNYSDIHERVSEKLDKYVLNIRQHYNPREEKEIEIEWDTDSILDVRKALYERIKKECNDDAIADLGVKLFEKLSKKDVDSAKAICDDYFEKNYGDLK